jgi:hypothetical protein
MANVFGQLALLLFKSYLKERKDERSEFFFPFNMPPAGNIIRVKKG